MPSHGPTIIQLSQSAPGHEAGRNSLCGTSPMPREGFNPRPAMGPGEIVDRLFLAMLFAVSIRARP